ncbi:c-type cytochrome [Sulfurimonas sp.]|uniref:c-type cytochrome n=1 Tax=Sulfurimonas sp. TaxID=2022749 RepID=UPI0019EF9D1C|nr:c-type cytochrome [Sulfurimonas sp.]MBE0515451.1 c-type cytochrome [Sulfurimonas sp.]
MRIVLLAVATLFIIGCSNENKQASEETATEEKSVAQSVKEVKSEVIETTQEVKEQVTQKAQEVKEEVASKVEEVKEEVVLKTQEVKEEVAVKVEEAKTAIAEIKVDAAKLYQVCAGCHGADGSKVALGKSQIIKGWDAQKIQDALNGYKAGTYGKAMKGIMVGQVSKLSDVEIRALAEHISKF